MSLHLFGAIITPEGVAANNRGETDGNISTLQKILWREKVHTTVSAEAIRWALRYYWQLKGEEVNRVWLDEKDDHSWKDPSWKGWANAKGKTYIDDDILGYMHAEGSKVEGEKGKALKRRGVLEISRAISLTPYAGDITFNAKSGEKGRTSLYGTEVHATRYQYNFAMTPERLREISRTDKAIDAIVHLGEVAGNQARFLYDFSPASIILRITNDSAPRILYCYELEKEKTTAPKIINSVKNGDIDAEELFIGGEIAEDPDIRSLKGINLYSGVKEATTAFKAEFQKRAN